MELIDIIYTLCREIHWEELTTKEQFEERQRQLSVRFEMLPEPIMLKNPGFAMRPCMTGRIFNTRSGQSILVRDYYMRQFEKFL